MKKRTRFSLFYLAGYLLFGGIGFLFVPRTMLELFQSNISYDSIMVQFIGVLLLSLGIVIVQIIRKNLVEFYHITLIIRSIIIAALLYFYMISKNPLMLILFSIVTVGFLFTAMSFILDKKSIKSKKDKK